jgi:hypothetical protein
VTVSPPSPWAALRDGVTGLAKAVHVVADLALLRQRQLWTARSHVLTHRLCLGCCLVLLQSKALPECPGLLQLRSSAHVTD